MGIKVIFRGFNFSQDGPGNRLVYHLQGCNLHCPWCSNPESIPENGSLLAKGVLDDNLCPFGAIKDGVLNRENCETCIEKPCTKGQNSSLQLSCSDMKIEEVIDEIKRSKKLFFDGGGVTFTGGEPTIQFDALKEVLSRLNDLDINTAVETNGTHIQLPELFELIDFLIIDCKHYNSKVHKKVIRFPNEAILKNIASALEQRSQLLIRIPLIGGFNASKTDAEGFANLFCNLNTENCSFELLRYHEYGKDKWNQCGIEYKMKNASVSDDDLNEFIKVFEAHNLKLVRT
ncbi:MAG: glycyl-radical enzyme activating protein [Eubacteriales bacterium]